MFLVLRAKERGIPVALAPLLGLVFNSVYTVGAWPAGWLSDRVPRHAVAAAGYAVYAGVYAVFAFATSHVAVWLAMATYGLYYALTEAVLKALVVSSVPREVRGRAVGIYSFGVSVCVLISSAATGFLWNRFGGTVPLAASAVLAAVAAVMLLTVGGTTRKQPSS
jgi:MFS family permease